GPHLARPPPPPGAGLPDVVLCPPAPAWAAHDHERCHGPFPPDAICPPHVACCWPTWSSRSCVRSATPACRSSRAPPPAAVFHLIQHDAKVVLRTVLGTAPEADEARSWHA